MQLKVNYNIITWLLLYYIWPCVAGKIPLRGQFCFQTSTLMNQSLESWLAEIIFSHARKAMKSKLGDLSALCMSDLEITPQLPRCPGLGCPGAALWWGETESQDHGVGGQMLLPLHLSVDDRLTSVTGTHRTVFLIISSIWSLSTSLLSQMRLKTRRESGVLNANSFKSFPGWISEVRSISPWEVKGKAGGVAKEGEEWGRGRTGGKTEA